LRTHIQFRRLRKQERESGQTILLVAVSLVTVLAMAALAIDVVTLYSARTEAQRTADAAALAGAKMLVDTGVTTDPCNTTLATQAQGFATTQATAVAQQNTIAGKPPGLVTVTYPNGSSLGCPGSFGVNPQITVQVQRIDLPIFFARIWSRTAASVSATATAEAYNPSNAASVGTAVPIAPRCSKPMILPNCDPDSAGHTAGSNSGCQIGPLTYYKQFVDSTTGAIANPGQYPTGVIGEQITLTSGCGAGSSCVKAAPMLSSSPLASTYYPLAFSPSALHLCPGSSSFCSTPLSNFQQDLQCCSGYQVQCGQQYAIDTTTNPDFPSSGPNAASLGGQCLIHENSGAAFIPGCTNPLSQDCLDPTQSPPRIYAGDNNPFIGATVKSGDQITTSDSVVTLALYDQATGNNPPPPNVTIVGYLQAFINDVQNNGTVTATILNVAGCGATSGTPVEGAASTIPVRLIH
jgi:hypothetical protein